MSNSIVKNKVVRDIFQPSSTPGETPFGTWYYDLFSKRVSWSEEVQTSLGLGHQVGTGFGAYLQLVVEEDKEKVTKCLQTAIAASGDFSFTHRLQLLNGEVKLLLTEIKVNYDQKGQPLLVLGVLYDITEKKDIQEENHRTSKVLHQNQKQPEAGLEELRQKQRKLESQNRQLLDFCNIMSHNLRAPLANMSMLVEAIEEAPNEADKDLYLSKLKPVVGNLQETFNELVDSLQLRQDGEVQAEEINIGQFVEKTLEGFEGQITKMEAQVKVDCEKAGVVVYPTECFSSILQNLISNALKYRSPDRKPEILISSEYSDGAILLKVKDNGLGIDLKQHGKNMFKIKKVFHRHPEAKGFGLYLTKTQVEALGGKIWVESTPDEGSTFFVEIPQ